MDGNHEPVRDNSLDFPNGTVVQAVDRSLARAQPRTLSRTDPTGSGCTILASPSSARLAA
jgi:hypothetical protein